MMFRDRVDAGKQLAEKLGSYYRARETIVVALPRGGVIVGHEIAKKLELPLDIVCPRKIGHPYNPEFAIGAVTENGDYILSQEMIELPEEVLKKAIETEKQEAERRLELYRKGMPPRHFFEKRIILVDDGLATGSTMKAAIQSIQNSKAKEIILAVPVSPQETLPHFSSLVDRIVCLQAPLHFHAVGQFYAHFEQVTDHEVITILQSQ